MNRKQKDRLQQYWVTLREQCQLIDAAVRSRRKTSERSFPYGALRRGTSYVPALDTPTDLPNMARLHQPMVEARRLITECKKQCPKDAAVFAEGEGLLDWYFNTVAPLAYSEMLELAERGSYEACHIDGEPIWPILT